MTRSTPLVFFGSDSFAAVVLTGLLGAGYDIRLVVTAPPNDYAGRQAPSHPVLELARSHRLTTFAPGKLDAQAEVKIREAGTDLAVLASYGKLLPEPVLGVFKAIINVHPSLLPRWRGPSPIEAAILAGTAKTGVSLMKLVQAMDTGPVYAQAELALSGQETQPQLTKSLAGLGRDLLIKHLPDIAAGRLEPTPQDETKASYCHLIEKTDGELDWRKPAADLARQIRAYIDWPRSRTTLFERDVIVTQAAAVSDQLPPGQTKAEPDRVIVGCQRDSLAIERLQPVGRSEMSAAEFLRGLKS